MVRILAARFPDREHAWQALESLHDRLDQSVEAEIAPLASGANAEAEDTLLAGHFPEEQAPRVQEIVRQAGGEIVADVDERWTRPRYQSGNAAEEGGGFTY
ncbi:MAG TPA: hypothetical protein VM305_09835 [Candidatus Limnocylindrales bacterium]|nr:hypothetical protein [Candidatus Limnocylindrales bacterium]